MPYLIGKGEGNQSQRAQAGDPQCLSTFTSAGDCGKFFSMKELR